MIAEKIQKQGGIGRGCVDPPPSVVRIPTTQEAEKKFVDTAVSMDLPPPIVMKLDSQGPPVSYTDATTKPPKKKSNPEDSVCL